MSCGKPWSAEELATLDSLAKEGKTCAEIARELSRPRAGVRHHIRMRRLIVTPSKRLPQFWTQDRLDKLRAMLLEGNSWREIAAVLQTTKAGAQHAAIRYKFDIGSKADHSHRHAVRYWSKERLAELREMHEQGKSWDEMAAKFQRSKVTCWTHLRRMGVPMGRGSRPDEPTRYWTGDEDRTIEDNYLLGKGWEEIADLIDRTPSACKARFVVLKENARRETERKQRKNQRGMRACLGRFCRGRRMFMSSHPGHRICPRCDAGMSWVYDGPV